MTHQSRLPDMALLGNPVLRKNALEVLDVYNPVIQSLIDTMLSTVVSVHGVGLAAPQLSQSLRIIVVASHPNPRYPNAPRMEPTPMINPVCISHTNTVNKDWEGCLSIPGLRGKVPRFEDISMQYTDRHGTIVSADFSGFIARIIQHEIDHLDGILFIDRITTSHDLISDQEYLKVLERK